MLPIASQSVRSGAALKCIQLCTIRNGRCWCQCSLWHYLPPENICVPVQLEYVKCCLSFGQCLALWYLSKHLFFSNLGTGMLLPNVNWRFYHFLHLSCSGDTDFKVQWWAKKKVAFKTSSFQNSLRRVINFIYCLCLSFSGARVSLESSWQSNTKQLLKDKIRLPVLVSIYWTQPRGFECARKPKQAKTNSRADRDTQRLKHRKC